MDEHGRKITRQDIEERLRSMTGGIEEQVTEARPTLVGTGVGAAVSAVLLAYLLGRRAGKRRSAIVEIRRA